MMVWSQPFIVLVAALLNTLSYCSAENVYCVTPNATSCSSSPHNSTNCTTLSEYAQEAELYFTSNTTMVFLSGYHTLNVNITVANVSRLTMRREPTPGNRATIVCKESVGLSFTSMVEFKMCSLAFTTCSRLLKHATFVPDVTPVYVALHLQFTQHAELVNCSFHDNNGTALVVNNTNITLTGNTEFTHNRACGNIIAEGGIIALSSNLQFTGSTTFLYNSAASEQYPFDSIVVGGGAIFASQNTVLTFSGTSNFTNNFAFRGGAIYTDYSVVRFNGTNNFINNFAFDGGAIDTYSVVLSLNGTNNFHNNETHAPLLCPTVHDRHTQSPRRHH